MKLIVETQGPVRVLTLNRPESRNAIDPETAKLLADAFRQFEADETVDVAVLTGAGGVFCAGADLKAVAAGDSLRLEPEGDAPLGPSRLSLSKPVIAAVSGHAVAGGLELALLCDLRVADATAIFGVFCRRWGVPLVDGGTVRLPRLIGQSRALDMILTGRPVGAEEALAFGLANRVVPEGQALEAAMELAKQLSRFPQRCLRSDRSSVFEQWTKPQPEALVREFELGKATIDSGETREGAQRFAAGQGRGGSFD